MKKLLLLLFSLFFISSPSVFADDISDFQIDGISIGDSLLDYYSIESQKEMSQAYDKKTKFTSIIISDPAFQTYNQIQVTHTEKKQKILAIEVLLIPNVLSIAISLVLFLTSIVRPEIILNAATIIMRVKIMNITFLSKFNASKKDLFMSAQE